MKVSRREFVKKVGLGSTALTIGGTAFGFSAKSYSQIKGANDRIRIAVVGVNSRGKAHIVAISKCSNISISYICDVDTRAAEAAAKMAEENTKERPKIQFDFRKLIEEKDLDLVTIATPEHWHAPMSIMAVKAGKNVYVEKPCAHNLREGEMLTELARKYPKIVIQMGVQGRSGMRNLQGIKDIQEGLIGDIYLAKAWYANERKTIGVGKKAPVPDWLNWELWQGPAPREEYKDNVVHYNWHWFRKWGTGEMGNNAIHQLDCCLWALGVDYPEAVTSYGGRFHFQDDWEFCDTQVSTYKYKGGKQIIWEGRSCNPFRIYDASNGVIFSGTKGTIKILPEDDNYTAYDLSGKIIRQTEDKINAEQPDLMGLSTMGLTEKHFMNTMESIRGKEIAHAPVSKGVKANALCLLGNIAQKLGRTLKIDTTNGKILDDKEADKMSSREYESGWEPELS
jgi:predicted dehydrogenase